MLSPLTRCVIMEQVSSDTWQLTSRYFLTSEVSSDVFQKTGSHMTNNLYHLSNVYDFKSCKCVKLRNSEDMAF